MLKLTHYSSEFMRFLYSFYENRRLIFDLTKRDLRQRYLGSNLGIMWAFIQPTVMILIMWFVFQVGFKSTPIDNFPFILWLITGMIPWNFFSDSISSSTGAILENSYLVKNVVFRVSVLNIVKICSSLLVHIFFLGVIFSMFLFYGYLPTVYNLQVFYYLFGMLVLLVGLSWISSSVVIFFRDTGQIISMVLQIGFWTTPIFWSTKIVPHKYLAILKLNPMYYIIDGYRNSFVYNIPFWENYKLGIYFWFITISIFILGAFIFRKLRPHFADVL